MKRLPLLVPMLIAGLCFLAVPLVQADEIDGALLKVGEARKAYEQLITELKARQAKTEKAADDYAFIDETVRKLVLAPGQGKADPPAKLSLDPAAADPADAVTGGPAYNEATTKFWDLLLLVNRKNGDPALAMMSNAFPPEYLVKLEAALRKAGKADSAAPAREEWVKLRTALNGLVTDLRDQPIANLLTVTRRDLTEARKEEGAEDPARTAAKEKLRGDLEAAIRTGGLNNAMFQQLYDKHINRGEGEMAGRVKEFNEERGKHKVPGGVTVAYEKGTGEDADKEYLVYQVGGRTVKRVMEVPSDFNEGAVPDAKRAAIQGIAASVLAGDEPKAERAAVVEAGRDALRHPLQTAKDFLGKTFGSLLPATAAEPHTKDERLEKLNKMHAKDRAAHATALGDLRDKKAEILARHAKCIQDAHTAAADVRQVPAGKTPEAWRDELKATCDSERDTALQAHSEAAAALKAKAQQWSERNIGDEYQGMYYDSIHQDINAIAGRLGAPGTSAEDDELRKLLEERYRVKATPSGEGLDTEVAYEMDPVDSWDLANNAEFKARIDGMIAMLKGEGKMEIAQGKPRFAEHEKAVEEYLREEVRRTVRERIGAPEMREPEPGGDDPLDQIDDLLKPKTAE